MLIVQKFVILLITARMILILARPTVMGTISAMHAIRKRYPVRRILTVTVLLQGHAILLTNMLNALKQKLIFFDNCFFLGLSKVVQLGGDRFVG